MMPPPISMGLSAWAAPPAEGSAIAPIPAMPPMPPAAMPPPALPPPMGALARRVLHLQPGSGKSGAVQQVERKRAGTRRHRQQQQQQRASAAPLARVAPARVGAAALLARPVNRLVNLAAAAAAGAALLPGCHGGHAASASASAAAPPCILPAHGTLGVDAAAAQLVLADQALFHAGLVRKGDKAKAARGAVGVPHDLALLGCGVVGWARVRHELGKGGARRRGGAHSTGLLQHPMRCAQPSSQQPAAARRAP